MEPAAAKAAWTLLLVLAYAATLPLLRCLTGLPAWTLLLLLLLPTASLRNALVYGQPYPLLLLLLSLSLFLLAGGRDLAAGLALAPVLALKLYAAPHVLLLLLAARWRALLGVALGLAVAGGLGVALLGLDLHATYLGEVLPRSLGGEIQDPYSPIWGSVSSLAHRLFQLEPDLNPRPAAVAPALVAPLARGLAAFLLALALACRPRGDAGPVLRQRWAAVTLAALAASPLTQSYHFVLLVLPVALLLAERQSPVRAAVLLALLAVATSPLPHYLFGLAQGWANLLAYPRLYLLLALLGLALRGTLDAARLAACGALALLAAMTSPAATEPDPDWLRVEESRGYLAAEPVACEGGIAWLTIEGERYVIRHSDGRVLRGGEGDLVSPRCDGGRLRATLLGPGTAASALEDDDSDRDAHGLVRVDPGGGSLFASDTRGERPLATGRFRRPRLSPDGGLVAAESWEEGSWDIRVFDRASGASRRLTSRPSNELEPSWSSDGRFILFASDWRRGLGSTALYRLELR